MPPSLKQRTRLIFLVVEAAILCIGSWLAFGTFVPAADQKGFWFYTALLGLILGTRLDTPFFAKPNDVIVYAAPAAIALLLCHPRSNWTPDETAFYLIAVAYCVTVGLIGATAILCQNARRDDLQRVSNSTRILAETLGAPRMIYAVVLAFSLYAFHRHSTREFAIILTCWLITAGLSPLEGTLRLGQRLRNALKPIGTTLDVAGEVVAYETPGVMLVRQLHGSSPQAGAVVGIHDAMGRSHIALALNFIGRDEGLLMRAIEIAEEHVPEDLERRVRRLPFNGMAVIPTAELGDESPIIKQRNTLVGLVAPDTSIERLFFEVVSDSGLEEGRLVETQIADRCVTYQIVNGVTKEEVVQHKNTHGYARAQAQKIGTWDTVSKRFRFVKWLPAPNAPVFLKAVAKFEPDADSVGHFPGTSYGVSIKNIDELVTHNTAILGILGVGKSSLAMELVERMIASGIKVICLDLTNQYATGLSPFYDAEYEARQLKTIQEAGEKDRAVFSEEPEKGGSMPALQSAVRADLEAFLDPNNSRKLKIYNPAQFTATKQTTEPKTYQAGGAWTRGAALWSITPVEITRIVTEAALTLLQGPMVEKARACLVYEEAHSLIPEWNAVASDTDRAASNGTARAILQGRKFGLGCLVVTQRSANVTKTILNQCNTLFAMRTFDETAKEFLSNYIGRDYAASLSSVEERHAVFFGKASSCENPVLIKLNDRESFTDAFRRAHTPPEMPKAAPDAGHESGSLGPPFTAEL